MLRKLNAAAIALGGFLLAAIYVYFEYEEYGPAVMMHLMSPLPVQKFAFHLLVLLAPAAGVYFAMSILQRDRLLDELKEKDMRYRDYYDNAPYGYHSADDGMVIIEVNRTWLDMLGYARSEVVGRMKVTGLMNERDAARAVALYPEFKRTGVLDDMDVAFRKADGSYIAVVLRSTGVYDEEGRFLRSRTIVMDNSERKQFEQALREVAEHWQSTFDTMPWGVMIVSQGCNIIRTNEYLDRHKHLVPEDIATEHCCELIQRMSVAASDSGATATWMSEFAAGEGVYRLYGRPMPGQNDYSTYIFSVVDITDIRRGERKLLDSRNAFFNMLKDASAAFKELDQVHTGLIYAFANAIDAKSPWTKGHSERVSRYAETLAEAAGLGERDLAALRTASLLHDIGKIGTVDYLLDKPGKLTDEEFKVMMEHPARSATILEPIGRLGSIIGIVRYHHEQYDGRGYPDGLKGESIPLMARILCLADSYDSITADRPYRPAQSREYAMAELRNCAGTHFDPELVKTFVKLIEEGKV